MLAPGLRVTSAKGIVMQSVGFCLHAVTYLKWSAQIAHFLGRKDVKQTASVFVLQQHVFTTLCAGWYTVLTFRAFIGADWKSA